MTILKNIALILCTLWAFQMYARDLVVCPDCKVNNVATALEMAVAGDTVTLMQGIYNEYGLIVDKSIVLRGIGHPVIDGLMSGEILTIVADSVIVSNITFRNVGTSYIEDRAAIRVKRADHFEIRNNTVLNSFFGIYLEKANSGIVAGNVVKGEAVEEMSSGNAIHLWYCKNVTVEDNIVSNHRDGIYFEFVDDSYAGCNISRSNLRYGLHFMFSNDDTYMGNTFIHNGAGVAVMFSRRIHMEDNIFRENWGKAAYGLLLKEIYDAEIRNNLFEKNTTGIFVEGSNRILYENNDFFRNGWALKISGGCEDNNMTGNNFIANSFDLSASHTRANHVITGNYWSDYSGYDLDKDGIGDVPHRPVKLFNYIVNKSPEAIILLRSIFIDLVNYSERVSPVFTPVEIADPAPLMNKQKTRYGTY